MNTRHLLALVVSLSITTSSCATLRLRKDVFAEQPLWAQAVQAPRGADQRVRCVRPGVSEEV